MTDPSSSSGLCSHPDRPLEDHLLSVWRYIEKEIKSKGIGQYPELVGMNHNDLVNIARTAALFHDLGKSTRFFQEYLFEKDKTKKARLKNDPRTSHGLFSALAVLASAYEKYPDNLERAIIPYIAVLHHHGNLHTVMHDFAISEKLDVLKEQWESIDKKQFDRLLNETGIEFSETLFQEILKGGTVQKEIFFETRDMLHKYRSDPLLFVFIQYIFSLLIDADKFDAAGTKIPPREKIPIAAVDEYRIEQFGEPVSTASYVEGDDTSDLNALRNRLYAGIDSHVAQLDLDQRIYSINAPTGSGKTLAVLNFALKLRDRIIRERGFTPRIIYSLPFLSIIEQNFKVFEDVLGGEQPSSRLLKHHHLSETNFTSSSTDKDDEYEPLESKALIESWNSEIIVTTFHQFFHTLFGYRNKQLRKYHRMANSIIILDEVQSFPHKYWRLFNLVSLAFARTMNSYIILMTATIPLIYSPDECIELVEDRVEYFKSLSRVKLSVDLEPQPLENLVSEVERSPDSSILFIVNWISAAEQLYKLLKDKYPDIPLFFLSTHVVPKQRFETIDKIKEYPGRKLLVSTQLIEAGVDVDFDRVIRDFAPLDSIIQSAGRCNRNAARGTGEVKIVRLQNENGKFYYRAIYDGFLCSKTEDLLKGISSVPESVMLELTGKYFENVSMGMSKAESDNLYKSACRLDFDDGDDSLSKFKLIENDFLKEDIFVQLDEDAINLWKRHVEIMTIPDRLKRKEELLRIKPDFYKYVISVSAFKLKNAIHPPYVDEISYMYCIPHCQLKDYYSYETGLYSKGQNFLW